MGGGAQGVYLAFSYLLPLGSVIEGLLYLLGAGIEATEASVYVKNALTKDVILLFMVLIWIALSIMSSFVVLLGGEPSRL